MARKKETVTKLTEKEKIRVAEIENQIAQLSKEYRSIVKPTKNEVSMLLEDLGMNPHVYTSFLENDDLWIAENVLTIREDA